MNSSALVRQRILGLLANTVALSPEDLNDSTSLVEEAPETFGRSVAGLHRELGLKILGGCGGTDDRHIRSLAAELAAGIGAGTNDWVENGKTPEAEHLQVPLTFCDHPSTAALRIERWAWHFARKAVVAVSDLLKNTVPEPGAV